MNKIHSRRALRRRARRLTALLLAAVCLLVGLWAWKSPALAARRRVDALETVTLPDGVEKAYIPLGGARSGTRLADFSGIVIHYVGNPGTTAMNNRNYFAKEETDVCSHFVVGLEGEVVQCLPLWERSVASNQRNRDTISIEVCHPDATGRFNAATYDALVELTAFLCRAGGLDTTAVIRHYDVTGKLCPLYYVEHESAWQQLLADVAQRL